MDYEEIKLVIIWEKNYRNRELNFDKKEKYGLELIEIFNKLLKNQMIDKLIERSIKEYSSSIKDPIIEGLTLAKRYIEKDKIYSNEDLENIDHAINQINRVRKEIELN